MLHACTHALMTIADAVVMDVAVCWTGPTQRACACPRPLADRSAVGCGAPGMEPDRPWCGCLAASERKRYLPHLGHMGTAVGTTMALAWRREHGVAAA